MSNNWRDMSDVDANRDKVMAIVQKQLDKGQRKYHDRDPNFQGMPLDHMAQEAADFLVYYVKEKDRLAAKRQPEFRDGWWFVPCMCPDDCSEWIVTQPFSHVCLNRKGER